MKPPEAATNGVIRRYDGNVPEYDGTVSQCDLANSEGEEDGRLLKSCSLNKLPEVPRDSFKAVYSIFFLFGICSVLPWNMFITANEYFSSKLHNTTMNATLVNEDGTNVKTSLQIMFESYFAVAAMVPNIMVQFLNLALQHRISLQVRIIVPLCSMLVLFALTTILTKVDTDEWQMGFFVICICSIVLINGSGAVFQGSIFGIASILPKRYMQAIMSGQGMGGILPSVLNIISISASSSADESGFIYFMCAVACIVITIGAFFGLPRIKYAAYYLNEHANMTKVKKTRELETTESFEKVALHTRPPFLEIFMKIKLPAILVLLVFGVTLGLFPATISSIVAVNTDNKVWATKYFVPVMCFLVFNTMDFTGRSLSVIQWPKDDNRILLCVFVLLRLVFFPLFAFCNLPTHGHQPHVIFTNDAYPIVFTSIFGFTNGYLGSLVMIYGPKLVEIQYRETGGVMMSLFLSAGLAIGAVISVLFLRVI